MKLYKKKSRTGVLLVSCVIVLAMLTGCSGNTPDESIPSGTPELTPSVITPEESSDGSTADSEEAQSTPVGEESSSKLEISVQNTEYYDPNQGEWDPVS